jgi:hypothetical protein
MGREQVTMPEEAGWLVNASYNAGQITLNLIEANTLEPFHWVDPNFQPYYLTEKQHNDSKVVKKVDLFSEIERSLYKVNATRVISKTVGIRRSR